MKYAKSLQQDPIINPFPGIVKLEQMLGTSLQDRIGSNESAVHPHPLLQQQLGAEFCELARLYPDPSALALRHLVAARYLTTTDNVLFDAGADSLILLALRMCCDPGDVVITSAGTYPTFRYFAQGVGARIIEVPYADDGVLLQTDLKALADSAREHNAALVYLANPDNPTGALHSRAAIMQLRAALPAETCLLLDEAYIDFCGAEESLKILPNTMHLRTLSKSCALAGLRLGYALADTEIIAKANQLRIHYALSNIAQLAAEIVLSDPDFIRNLVADTITLREQLRDKLQEHQLKVLPSATNFVAIRYADAEQAAEVQKRLWAMHAAVHRPPHPALQHLIRITAQPRSLDDDIVEALTVETA